MDLNLVNLGVDSYGKNLQSCTTDVETFKLFISNGLMDINLSVDLYGKDLQSCITDVETFKTVLF